MITLINSGLLIATQSGDNHQLEKQLEKEILNRKALKFTAWTANARAEHASLVTLALNVIVELIQCLYFSEPGAVDLEGTSVIHFTLPRKAHADTGAHS
jgi:hypothetical protein